MSTISPEAAMIYVMVTVSAADASMTDRELKKIGDIVRQMPKFREYDSAHLVRTAQDCAAILSAEKDGLSTVLALAKQALSPALRQSAFAYAVEVAASDARINLEELRVLDLLRQKLDVDRLFAAAVEASAAARFRRPEDVSRS